MFSRWLRHTTNIRTSEQTAKQEISKTITKNKPKINTTHHKLSKNPKKAETNNKDQNKQQRSKQQQQQQQHEREQEQQKTSIKKMIKTTNNK